jgi:dTDP-4-dehydrorhamnose 3,5-epimerase
MIFSKTGINGAYVIKLEKNNDMRGFFARTWDAKEFKKFGLNPKIVQCSVSFNKKKGTIRGMHYQINPYGEDKLIRCTRGKIFDVIIDLRPKSSTFKKWFGVELSDKNYKMLYIPEGVAHGFQTLEDNAEVFYQISEFFMSKYARGIRWNDEVFRIRWPLKPTIISKKDRAYEPFDG